MGIFHRPGLPEDLPEPRVLWARWGLVAVLTATTEDEGQGIHRTGFWAGEQELRRDDCGCTWWTLAHQGDGRFVLYGEDESSDVKWHKPPIDMLSGVPDWLPFETLRDLLEGYELGCVYWWEKGAWARASYPTGLGDDGLDCGMSLFADWNGARNELAGFDRAVTDELLAAAEAYRLTPRALEGLVDETGAEHWDLPAMLRSLRQTGLGAGTVEHAS